MHLCTAVDAKAWSSVHGLGGASPREIPGRRVEIVIMITIPVRTAEG
jgi:hypothetical protein